MSHKENVPSPASNLLTVSVVYFGSITELVTILVGAFRFLIVKTDGVNT